MFKTKITKSALISSVVAMIICFAMLLGTTFAWFTDSATSGSNVIQAGNLDIVLEYWDGDSWEDAEGKVLEFKKGGNYNGVVGDVLWEPGCTYELPKIRVRNEGSLATYVVLKINGITGDEKLLEAIEFETKVSNTPASLLTGSAASSYKNLEANPVKFIYGTPDGTVMMDWSLAPKGETTTSTGHTDTTAEFTISGHMAEEAGNEYQGLKIKNVSITALATQQVYEYDSFGREYDKDAKLPVVETVAVWDGTADTSWYNDTAMEFTLTTAEQFAGLAKLVDAGNSFAGKTIELANDLDLYLLDDDGERVTFDPIGDKVPFEGTFDGQGHTIENLWQNGWDLSYDWYNYGSIGLFGEVKDATVKNVTISGLEALVEGGDISFIAGSATGTCVFENIEIKDSTIGTYNNGCGGIIGWSGAGNYTFKDITIAEDVVLGGLWGSFDSSIGGVVGQAEPGATYNFENVEISCRLDVYNDCTASYDYYNYRMCGMLIGRCAKTTTIDGVNYPDMSQYNVTCTNVTVNYGDWMNYHYCEPTPGYNNGRGMRVEPGYAYDGLPADYDHSQCITNHNTLIPFDQIIGGDQLGVKGLKTYEGVTVVYPNN